MTEKNKNFWLNLSCLGGSFLVVVVGLILVWPAKPLPEAPVGAGEAVEEVMVGAVEKTIKPLSPELSAKIATFKLEVAKVMTEEEKGERTLEAILLYNSVSQETGQPPVIKMDRENFQTALINSLK